MKSLIQSVVLAAALAAPAISFAQSNASLTRAQFRAQVNAQLAELENVGYNPAGEHLYYPEDLQAAEARVAVQNRATTVGGVASGSTRSGPSLAAADSNVLSSPR